MWKSDVPRVRLLDIEGTVAPIDFVYRTLFPFARQRIATFLDHPLDAESRAALQALAIERKAETRAVPADDVGFLLWLMDRDSKCGPLKTIQGKIWQQGYESGELVSELYSDVPGALSRWTQAGLRIAIFSSGSILAQQLFFRYTQFGDLTPLIDAYFDTSIGSKRDPRSYSAIAARVDARADHIEFFSDVVEELDSAAGAGMQMALTIRPGNREIPSEKAAAHKIVRNFDEIP